MYNISKILLIFVSILYNVAAYSDLVGGDLYLKGDFMVSKFTSSNISDVSNLYNHESKSGIVTGGGLGVTLPMGFRGEIVYNHIFPITYKHFNVKGSTELTGSGDALILRGCYDILDLQFIKTFIGAGIGFSRIKHDWFFTGFKAKLIDSKQRTELSSTYKQNIAYNVLFGISANIISNLELDLGYLYADYGKTKTFPGLPGSSLKMKSHNLLIGVRYEL